MKWTTALIVFSAMLMLCGCGKKEDNSSADKSTGNVVTTVASTQTETVASTETAVVLDTASSINFERVLENSAFIGDSVTSGFGGYQKVDVNNVFATLNVGPSNIRDYSFAYNGGEYAALTILDFEQPEHIVISMGLNDINTYSPEDFSELYMEYVDDAMTVCKDSQFYVFSVTPVSPECSNIKNTTIDAVNAQLKKTVEGYGIERLHYVDCNSVLKGADGYMDSSYSAGDGIHLNSSAYDVILEELKNVITALKNN